MKRTARAGLAVLAVAVLLQGCAMRLVADYDKRAEDDLIATYESISRFYDTLAATPAAERQYDPFAPQYAEVATDLRVLILRESARPLNGESAKIVTNILAAWEATRDRHQRYSADPARAANPYPDSLIDLDRTQFDDHFRAAVTGEQAKQ